MKAYVLKYWATDGICLTEGEITKSGNFLVSEYGSCIAYASSEFAFTLEEARGKVEALRNKKIVSLVKKLDKIKTMKVKVYE